MESFHDNIVRMILQCVSRYQRVRIERVLPHWRYLVSRFRISKSYSFVESFGSQGRDNGQFKNSKGIDVNNNNNRVQIFDKNSKFLSKFELQGPSDKYLYGVYDIKINQSS